MIIGSALLLGLFYFPLWYIDLVAPQYPEHLGMYIHINDIKGLYSPNDITNIDGLNHYIGMRPIPKPEDMWEFEVFPMVIGGMATLGILIGLLGVFKKVKPIMYIIWLGVMSVLGILGMYDFNEWLNDYGTNLDPKASIKLLDTNGELMTYKPPLMGHQKMLNFDVESWPSMGAYLMFVGLILVFVAFIVGQRALKKSN